MKAQRKVAGLIKHNHNKRDNFQERQTLRLGNNYKSCS